MTIVGPKERALLGVLAATTLIFLLLPSLMLFASSLNGSQTLTFPPESLTLRWYGEALATLTSDGPGAAGGPLTTSLIIAVASAGIAVAAGVPAAYALVRFRLRGRAAFETLVSLPLVFPAMSLGIGFLVLFSAARVDMPYGRLVIADAVIVLPFVIRNVGASLVGIGRSLEEAAWTLGATRLEAVRKIVLPLAMPGIAAGYTLSFIIAFNEVTIAFFLYTPGVQPFSIWVMQRTESAFDTSLTAIGGLILFLNLAVVWLLRRLSALQAR